MEARVACWRTASGAVDGDDPRTALDDEFNNRPVVGPPVMLSGKLALAGFFRCRLLSDY
jgi:hypothetical protein